MKRLLALTALAVLAVTGVPTSVGTPVPVECIAHRGGTWPGHTEETTVNYRTASASGVAEIEGDVRFTKPTASAPGGFPVMLHDATMGVFGAPTVKIADVTTTQASAYAAPTGEHLATLYAVYTVLADSPGLRGQFEMKVKGMTEDQWDMIESRLSPVRDRVTITSFDLATVRAAQDHGWRTAYLSGTDTVSTAAPSVVELSTAIDAAHVSGLAGVGVQTQAYTPDTPTEWDALAAAGVTAMVTDDPLGCMAWNEAR